MIRVNRVNRMDNYVVVIRYIRNSHSSLIIGVAAYLDKRHGAVSPDDSQQAEHLAKLNQLNRMNTMGGGNDPNNAS